MHPTAYQFVEALVQRMPPARVVVEIGSRQVHGGVRVLFSGAQYVGVDLMPGDGVDVMADAATWRPPTPVDVVVCTSTLEHVVEPERLVKAAWEMLRENGILILTTVTDGATPHSSIDGGPLAKDEHYRNIGSGDLAQWLEQFRFFSLEYIPPDLFAWATK